MRDKNLAIGIAAGQHHTVVIGGAPDGSVNTRVWSVGQGTHGQMGNGAKPEKNPFRVPASNLTQVTKVDAGERHTLALDSAGRLWAWGQNLNGEIGDGTTTDRDAGPGGRIEWRDRHVGRRVFESRDRQDRGLTASEITPPVIGAAMVAIVEMTDRGWWLQAGRSVPSGRSGQPGAVAQGEGQVGEPVPRYLARWPRM